MNELDSLLDRLCEARFDFVVVGGYAAVAHGVTLLTQDLDVCCDFSLENLQRLQAAVADLHPVHRMTPNRMALELDEKTAKGLMNLYLDTDIGQLDCLGELVGVGPYRLVRQHAIAVPLGKHLCHILSLEALIQSKAQLDRPRDREAIAQLRLIAQRKQDSKQNDASADRSGQDSQ
jgi:hypothetical protein